MSTQTLMILFLWFSNTVLLFHFQYVSHLEIFIHHLHTFIFTIDFCAKFLLSLAFWWGQAFSFLLGSGWHSLKIQSNSNIKLFTVLYNFSNYYPVHQIARHLCLIHFSPFLHHFWQSLLGNEFTNPLKFKIATNKIKINFMIDSFINYCFQFAYKQLQFKNVIEIWRKNSN